MRVRRIIDHYGASTAVLFFTGTLLLGGCVTSMASEPNGRIAHGRGRACRSVDFSGFVGQPAAAVAARIRKLSGAVTVRWLPPGQVADMDLRDNRVSIELDALNRVRALRCG